MCVLVTPSTALGLPTPRPRRTCRNYRSSPARLVRVETRVLGAGRGGNVWVHIIVWIVVIFQHRSFLCVLCIIKVNRWSALAALATVTTMPSRQLCEHFLHVDPHFFQPKAGVGGFGFCPVNCPVYYKTWRGAYRGSVSIRLWPRAPSCLSLA